MEGAIHILFESKSKTFLLFCFCFIFGIAVFSFQNTSISSVYLMGPLLVTFFFALLFWKNIFTRYICIAILCVLLGVLRLNILFPSASDIEVSSYNDTKQTLQGFISDEPDIRQDAVHYAVSVEKIYRDGMWQDVHGKIALKTNLYPRYAYGQNIELHCTLETPKPFEDFRYDKYLALHGIWSVCQMPGIQTLEGVNGNRILASIYNFKSQIAQKINLLWHEPYASFVAGLLYGYRGGLGSLSEDFNRTGVTHIVAVSGFNITIIAIVLQSIFLACLIPRRKAFWCIVSAIFVFVIFTGASASVVRAGIMGILALLAKQMGRTSRMDNVLVSTVVLMTLFNPFILIWDVGFQLSFLSTCGLIYLSPHIEKYFTKVPKFFGLRESLVSTMSAIFSTLPLILFQFGRLSLVAPLVNMLILPTIPWIMALGFATVVLSFLFFPFAVIFASITYLGLAYIVQVVRLFSNFALAAVDMTVSVWGMLVLYALLIYFIVRQQK